MATTGGAKFVARRICKQFVRKDASIEVLRDIDLQVEPSELVAVVGPSGCGKTTLLRILDGLIAASSGEIIIDGKPVTGPGSERGVVFQQDSLFPWRTVLDNVAMGLEFQGSPRKERRDLARPYVELVGLANFEHYYPHELSGGMRQRVNLARALAIRPQVLLMDEPFAALDAQTRELMQQELLRIWSKETKTVLFVTHQIDEAVYLGDRVVILSARPGTVLEILDIDLPRPRQLEVKRSQQFSKYVDHIWMLIRGQALENLYRAGPD